MKILLDTHIWLWYLLEDPRLSKNLQVMIADSYNEIWLSPVIIWEALLVGEKGRVILDPDPVSWVKSALKTLETREASLNNEIAILSRQLDCPHQDPADRFIAATAIYYNLYLATVDKNLINTPSLQIIK
jgi:PIN domain nuclease of toxin-antitoxin system